LPPAKAGGKQVSESLQILSIIFYILLSQKERSHLNDAIFLSAKMHTFQLFKQIHFPDP
jgi:hypothetical protein